MRTEGQAEDRLTDTYRRDRRTDRVETDGQPRERDTDTEQKDGQRRDIRKQRVETDGQTNTTKLMDAFCDYAKVPKK
jgi:hypothetical protein